MCLVKEGGLPCSGLPHRFLRGLGRQAGLCSFQEPVGYQGLTAAVEMAGGGQGRRRGAAQEGREGLSGMQERRGGDPEPTFELLFSYF